MNAAMMMSLYKISKDDGINVKLGSFSPKKILYSRVGLSGTLSLMI